MTNTRIKCSALFEYTTTRIMRLNDIEFQLEPYDIENNKGIDEKLIKEYLIEMWCCGDIDPANGIDCGEDGYLSFSDDDVREIVSFEVIESPKPLPNPNQCDLWEENNEKISNLSRGK